MAIFHLSVKPISRKGGRSATAAAAYRSGELIHDHTSGEVFDYTRKRGVEHSEIVLSTEAAKQDINWARDRQTLWNAAEASENRSNSRVAREYELALPHEMTHEQRVELTRAFATDIANRYQVAVDFSIHAPHWNGDDRNHHAHVLTTTRTIEAGGLGEKTEIEWSDTDRRGAGLVPARKEVDLIRTRWEELVNEHLQRHQIEARVDHRSLAAQGIEREPTSHLGPAVSALERRGVQTEVGQRISLEVASRRLEQAAEEGKLERERAQVQRSIFEVSTDLAAAKQERDRAMAPASGQKPTTDLERLQAQGREQWLKFREEQQVKARERGQTPAESRPIEKTSTLSLEQERLQAAERWAAYRAMTPEQRQAHDQQQAQERGQEPGRERSPGRDGPEIE